MNMTVKAMADRLGIALSTAYLLLRENRIAHLRIGSRQGAIRIPEEAVVDFIKSSMIAVKEQNANELLEK